MQVWTLHPRYLDKIELTQSWNEGLKALQILSRPNFQSRFYSGLSVFRMQSQPVYALTRYLQVIAHEGVRRGLEMDASLLPAVPDDFRLKIPVSLQRFNSDREKLIKQLAKLGSARLRKFDTVANQRTHPLFFLHLNNKPEAWELMSRIRLRR